MITSCFFWFGRHILILIPSRSTLEDRIGEYFVLCGYTESPERRNRGPPSRRTDRYM